MVEELDVLVVGGGPAGLAAAEFAAAGGSTLVVHRDREIGIPVRTSGASWLPDIIRLGIPSNLYQVLDSLLFVGPQSRAFFSIGDRPAVALDVTRTYRYLAERAEQAGARIECGTELTDIVARNSDSVTCRIASGSNTREIRARYLLDASGQRRAVLSKLSLRERPVRVGVGAEVECEDLSRHRHRAVLFVGEKFTKAGYGWLFPTRNGTVRIGVGVIRPDSLAPPAVLLARFLISDEAQQMEIKVGPPLEKHSGIIPSDGPSRDLVFGRVIGVGDSVGQALPLVGEGIRFCIEAGREAGQAVARALQDPSKQEQHLRRYEAWWQRSYYQPFLAAQRINERISRYTDPQWEEKIELLATLDSHLMTMFLRMEVNPRTLARALFRHPAPLLNYAQRRLYTRLARALHPGG